MGVWFFRGVRFLLALASIVLAFGVVAYLSTEAEALTQVGAPEWTIWLGRARIVAAYLLPLSLFLLAVWPRLWLVALLPIAVLVGAQFALNPGFGSEILTRLVG
jgi:hypothetical protein